MELTLIYSICYSEPAAVWDERTARRQQQYPELVISAYFYIIGPYFTDHTFTILIYHDPLLFTLLIRQK